MRRKHIVERRKTQRLKIPLQIKYYPLSKKKILREEVRAQNISGGGMGLRLKQSLKIGSRLKTLLYFPLDRRPISAISEVVWCREKIKGKRTYFVVGIRHLKVASKDRERFVYLFCETMINFLMLQNKIILR